AKRSETGRPDLPYRLKAKGERMAPAVLRSVRRLPLGSALPWYLSRSGLGSKVSTWLGPPFMNRWTKRFALAGEGGPVAARPSWRRTAARPARPTPARSCRRERAARKSGGDCADIGGPLNRRN